MIRICHGRPVLSAPELQVCDERSVIGRSGDRNDGVVDGDVGCHEYHVDPLGRAVGGIRLAGIASAIRAGVWKGVVQLLELVRHRHRIRSILTSPAG